MGQLDNKVWTALGPRGCEKEQRREGGLGGFLFDGETEQVFRLKSEDRGGGLRRSWEESDNTSSPGVEAGARMGGVGLPSLAGREGENLGWRQPGR